MNAACLQAASGAPNDPTAPVNPAPASDGWQVSVTPYAWLTSLKGDMGVSPLLPAVKVDEPFANAALDGAIIGARYSF